MKTIRAEGGVYHGAVHDERLQPAATFVPPPHPWGALVTACIALFLIAVNTTAINTAVSAIADDLTLSSTTLAWAMNAYLLDLTDVSTTYSGLWLPTLVAGIGVGMTFSTPSAAGLQAVPPEECGEASGIINIFRYVGASMLVIAVTSVGGLVLWLVLMRPGRRGGGGFAHRRRRSPSLRRRRDSPV